MSADIEYNSTGTSNFTYHSATHIFAPNPTCVGCAAINITGPSVWRRVVQIRCVRVALQSPGKVSNMGTQINCHSCTTGGILENEWDLTLGVVIKYKIKFKPNKAKTLKINFITVNLA